MTVELLGKYFTLLVKIILFLNLVRCFSTFSMTAAPIYVIGSSHAMSLNNSMAIQSHNMTIKIAHHPMDHLIIQETALLLEKTFDLKIPEKLSTEDELVGLMTPIIHQMLNRDFEKLLQVCYRVDLGENKLKQILHESDPEMMAFDLAKALVERQIRKVEIRNMYSGS